MRYAILFVVLTFFRGAILLGDGGDVIGFWKTIDDKTGKPQSVVAVYEYQGKYYGRLIVTYDENGQIVDTIMSPQLRAPGIKGHPYYSGLDILWDLQPKGNRYSSGKIVDPEKGRIYDAEIWRKNNNLVVRGEVWVFGQNQEWLPVQESDFPQGFIKPNLSQLKPVIPEVTRVQTASGRTKSSKANR